MKILVKSNKNIGDIPDKSINDSITGANLTENQKTFLDISLVEYKELRTELREVIARQNSVLLSSIAQFATLMGLILGLLSADTPLNEETFAGTILCFLIPCITMILGIIWLDLAYRQINIGSYVYQIEKQAIEMLHLGSGENLARKVLFWEHHINNLEKKRFFTGGNIWSYLCSLFMYFFALIISLVLGIIFFGWQKWYIITFILFFIYLVCISVYIVNIYIAYKSKN